jgi:hypothetical protein
MSFDQHQLFAGANLTVLSCQKPQSCLFDGDRFIPYRPIDIHFESSERYLLDYKREYSDTDSHHSKSSGHSNSSLGSQDSSSNSESSQQIKRQQ